MSGEQSQCQKELLIKIASDRKNLLQNRLLRESPKAYHPKDITETYIWPRENEGKGIIGKDITMGNPHAYRLHKPRHQRLNGGWWL